ncbi:hypothetical protein P3G55_22155 [Leptospira sp. 96542]|nr:hypothetical protein [Leptospira sp. 96542]
MIEKIYEIYRLIINNELILTFSSVIQTLGSFSIAAFGLYFIFQKIGYKIIALYTIHSDSLSITRISEIVLINKKNQPVVINSIEAIFDKKYRLELEKFHSPLILKPLESIHITTEPISNTYLEGEKYEIPYYDRNRIEIQIISVNKRIKCKLLNKKRKIFFPKKIKYISIKKISKIFNNIVYSDQIMFAIVYSYNSIEHTAFVHKNGIITGDWIFKYNMIPNNYLISEKTISYYIDSLKLGKSNFNFSVEELN